MPVDDTLEAEAAPLTGELLARKGDAGAAGFADVTGHPDAKQAPAAARQVKRCWRRILIVEYDALNRKMLADLFEVHGYEPMCTADHHEALMLARGFNPDLAVVDVSLRGCSGLGTISQFKHDEGLVPIPVIAVSAAVVPHEVAIIRQSGCNDFLAKPFPVKQTLERVALLLH